MFHVSYMSIKLGEGGMANKILMNKFNQKMKDLYTETIRH